MTAPADVHQMQDAPVPAAAPAPVPPPQRTGPAWNQTALRQAAAVSSKLAPLARQAGDRVAAASPLTLLAAMLGVLTTLSIVASLSSDTSLGVASAVLFVPALSAALGALAMRGLATRRSEQAAREDARQDAAELRQLEHTLDYVDNKLNAALTQFGSERHNDAVVAMFQAKAATELYRGSAPGSHPDSPEKHYALAEFLAPAALHAGDAAERPAGLSVI